MPVVSAELFGMLVFLYSLLSCIFGWLLSRRTRQLFRTSELLRESTQLLVDAHRALKLAGPSDLTTQIERHMRKRLHNGMRFEVSR